MATLIDPLALSRYHRHQRWRSLVWRLRHSVLVAVLLLASFGIALLIRPAPPATVAAVLLGHAITAGDVVRADDLLISAVSRTSLPQSAFPAQRSQVAGLRAVVDLPAGTILTQPLLSRSGLGQILPPGRVAVAVPDSGAALTSALVAGDLVNLLTSAGAETAGPARPVARRAVVLPRGLLTAGASSVSPPGQNASLLVAVTGEEAQALAGIGPSGDVSVVLVE